MKNEAKEDVRFQVGAAVEFELGIGIDGKVDGRPRWNHERDRGGTGRWCAGKLSGRTPHGDWLVDFTNPVTGWSECWSFPADPLAAARPGWLRPSKQEGATCECGASRIWGQGPHSVWCPRYQLEQVPGKKPKSSDR